MQYVRILALIDAELDRLQEARQLLASLLLVPRDVQKRTPPARRPAASRVAKEEQSPALPQEPAVQTEIARPKRVRRAPLREKPAVRKPAAAPLPSALGGSVPVAPVFVSAEVIRQAIAQKQQAQAIETTRSNEAASDPLTSELLARKWLHSSTS
jgi:hypothetical protein